MKPKYILWLIVAIIASTWFILDPAATLKRHTIDAQLGNQSETSERRKAIDLDRPTARADSDR